MEVFGPRAMSWFVCLGLNKPVGSELSVVLWSLTSLQKPVGWPGGLRATRAAGNFRTCGPSEKDPLAQASKRVRVWDWTLRKQWLGEPHMERPWWQEVALHKAPSQSHPLCDCVVKLSRMFFHPESN